MTPIKALFWVDIPGMGFDLTMLWLSGKIKQMDINKSWYHPTLARIQQLSVFTYLIAYF